MQKKYIFIVAGTIAVLGIVTYAAIMMRPAADNDKKSEIIPTDLPPPPPPPPPPPVTPEGENPKG